MDILRRRLEKLLEALDDLGNALDDDDFMDLNAEFEDAIFMLADIDPEDPEERADALETLRALAEDYMKWPEARELAGEISEAARHG